MNPTPSKKLPTAAAGAVLITLAGCAASPESVVPGPLMVPVPAPPMFVERPATGAIFQPGMQAHTLFSSDRRPSKIGDTLKVDIDERLKASQQQSSDSAKDSRLSAKGPGGRSSIGAVDRLLNMDASASGSSGFKGNGSTEATTSFTGQLAVSVINVLPNGHLIVAGERKVGLNREVSALRFSGVVNPRDIGPGNVVQSRDVLNASIESVAQGDISEGATRSWLQRLLGRAYSVW